MIDLAISDVRPFLPSKDFAISKDFYVALGWTIEWSDDTLALMHNAGRRFYLQRYYAKEFAENSMLHIGVADARACHAQIRDLLDSGRFPEARVAAPKREPYGALVTYVWDPAGVLLHLAQWMDA
jgi:hypothetical protein